VAPADYRNPGLIPPGGVLVVGASASGVQIADELQRSGRSVTLAVGEHVRMPRTYRGRDIFWWLDASGVLDERYEAQPDLVRARNLRSMQLVGSPQRETVDLNALRRRGVRLVGRFVGVRDDVAQFSGALPNVCALADLKLGRLLDTLDAWADRAGIDAEATARPAARRPDRGPRAGERRRAPVRALGRLRHRRPRRVRGRARRRQAADPLPPARDPAGTALGLHPDGGLPPRRRPAGRDRPTPIARLLPCAQPTTIWPRSCPA
jgi:hypothetical protein